jgi:shikimate kinase
MNIVLVGFRCCGKTTIGKSLAEHLGMTFIDADERVEQKHHMTIREIFEKKGETVFRLWESDAIAEAAKLDGHVIATGGGAVLRYKNIRNLKRNSVIVFLSVSADTAYERIQRDDKSRQRRPPLTNQDPHTEVREQHRLREPIYQGVADIVIDTTEDSVAGCVEQVLARLKEFRIGQDGEAGAESS